MIEKLDKEQQKEAIRKIEKLSKEHPDIIGHSNTKQKNEVSLTVLDLSRKQVILSFLEDAAKYFEYYIPRHLSSGDKSTDDWFKNSMKQVAAALREKKKWILTPMEDTAEYLIAKMTSTLVFVVTDNWHALEREEPEKITYQKFTHRLLSSLSKFLKLSFVGLFPLLFLIILQQTQFAITGPVRDYAFIISLGWFVLTFLINVDSSISTKISLIKDFKSLFSSNDITPKP